MKLSFLVKNHWVGALVHEQLIIALFFVNNYLEGQLQYLFRPLLVKGNKILSLVYNKMLVLLFHSVEDCGGGSAGLHKTYPKLYQIINKWCRKKGAATMIPWAWKLCLSLDQSSVALRSARTTKDCALTSSLRMPEIL